MWSFVWCSSWNMLIWLNYKLQITSRQHLLFSRNSVNARHFALVTLQRTNTKHAHCPLDTLARTRWCLNARGHNIFPLELLQCPLIICVDDKQRTESDRPFNAHKIFPFGQNRRQAKGSTAVRSGSDSPGRMSNNINRDQWACVRVCVCVWLYIWVILYIFADALIACITYTHTRLICFCVLVCPIPKAALKYIALAPYVLSIIFTYTYRDRQYIHAKARTCLRQV